MSAENVSREGRLAEEGARPASLKTLQENVKTLRRVTAPPYRLSAHGIVRQENL
jgi:hypothetical protein